MARKTITSLSGDFLGNGLLDDFLNFSKDVIKTNSHTAVQLKWTYFVKIHNSLLFICFMMAAASCVEPASVPQ